MKFLLVPTLVALVTVRAMGCTCFFTVEKQWIRERIQEAEVILLAELKEQKFDTDDQTIDSISYDYVMTVARAWKGVEVKEINLSSRELCGVKFKSDVTYIIFAYTDHRTGKLTTGGCSTYSIKKDNSGMAIGRKNFRFLTKMIKRYRRSPANTEL